MSRHTDGADAMGEARNKFARTQRSSRVLSSAHLHEEPSGGGQHGVVVIQLLESFLEIDEMDLVLGFQQVRPHFRVPLA